MRLSDLTVEHGLGALAAWLIGAGFWNLNRTLFPEAPDLLVTVGLLAAGVVLAEVVLS